MINRSEYYKNHRACPECNSTEIVKTCAGYFDKDLNRATCSKCGWRGVVDDLVKNNINEEV